jgi:hypothetical protein
MYSVVSSVETINSGSTGQTDVPHAAKTISSNILVDSDNVFILALRLESSFCMGKKWVEPMRARLLIHPQMEFSAANLVVVLMMLVCKIETLL